MEQITESFELYGKQYTLSTGELAKQASGAVKVTQGDTTVLVTAVISEQEKDYDFFPLTVELVPMQSIMSCATASSCVR